MVVSWGRIGYSYCHRSVAGKRILKLDLGARTPVLRHSMGKSARPLLAVGGRSTARQLNL